MRIVPKSRGHAVREVVIPTLLFLQQATEQRALADYGRAALCDKRRDSCFAACANSSMKLSTTKTLWVGPTPRQKAVRTPGGSTDLLPRRSKTRVQRSSPRY